MALTFSLKNKTSPQWLETVLDNFDSFLLDHANCEKKASGMAMSMISHYPDKPQLIKEMLNLAIEELSHFRDVMRLILERELTPASDTRDEYIKRLHSAMDQGKEAYLLDRLLVASIVEARGAERFALIAQALPAGKLQRFYQAITDSETRHFELFLQLAYKHCPVSAIPERLEHLLIMEAEIISTLPHKARLH